MDANQCSICGEESFGTGSDHVRYTPILLEHVRQGKCTHDAARCNYDSTWVASVSKHFKSVTNLVQGEGRALGCVGVAVGAGVC
jgi:phosphoglucomutase